MSEITLCLITKGRPEFLEQLLESFNRIVEYPYVRFHIILNGTSEEVRERFETWANTYQSKVEITFVKENNPNLGTYLPVFKSIKSEWVCFPSDDDIIEREFFKQWENFISNFTDCGAIATNMDLIDDQGKLLGILKKPSYTTEIPPEESAAKSLSECPFLWPGLIIKVSELPTSLPSTRYVSDWWIGLHLIFTSNVRVVDDVFTRYRVHEQQESNVSSLSRKNLEALVHLGTFIRSKEFSNWIIELDVIKVVGFLESLIKYPPIYGDTKFSGEFVSLVTQTVEALRIENDIRSAAKLVNAYFHGVIIDDSTSICLENSTHQMIPAYIKFNSNFIFDQMCCQKIKSAQSTIYSSSEVYPEVLVGCLHGNKPKKDFVLNCEAIDTTSQLLDALAQGANAHFEKLGAFERSVSRFEYSLILKVRRFKKYIPSHLNRIMHRSRSI